MLERQVNHESAARYRFPVEFHLSAVGRNRPMNNRESQTSAAFGSGTRFVDAIGALKDLFRVLGRNSRAAVPDLDDRIPIGGMYIHSNLSACRRILHGVIDEIDQSLAQDQAVSLDRDGRMAIHDDRLVLFFGQDIEQCSGFLQNIKQTERRLLQVICPASALEIVNRLSTSQVR